MAHTKSWSLAWTSPASATTEIPAAGYAPDMGMCDSLLIYAAIRGGTGGTLDIYLQMSPDMGTTWVDYAHFAQLADGAAAIKRVWTVSKSAQQTSIVTVGSGSSPALAANTIIGGEFGDRIRVVNVAGVGTSAGAAQAITIVGTRSR